MRRIMSATFVDAAELVRRRCLARGASRSRGIFEKICRGYERRACPPATRNRGQARRSSEFAIAVDAFMDNAGCG